MFAKEMGNYMEAMDQELRPTDVPLTSVDGAIRKVSRLFSRS